MEHQFNASSCEILQSWKTLIKSGNNHSKYRMVIVAHIIDVFGGFFVTDFLHSIVLSVFMLLSLHKSLS